MYDKASSHRFLCAASNTTTLCFQFRFADKKDVLLTILGLLCAAASGMSWPGLALVFGAMLDSFLCFAVAANNAAANLTNSSPSCIVATCGAIDIQDDIHIAAVRFSIVGAGAWVTMYLYVMLLIWSAERQTRRMREAFFRAIMRQEIGWFDTSDPGELATRLTEYGFLFYYFTVCGVSLTFRLL